MKIQPEYINIHLLVVPNSTIFDDDGFFFHVYKKFNIYKVQCDSSLPAIRKIELAMHHAMKDVFDTSRYPNYLCLMFNPFLLTVLLTIPFNKLP